MHLKSLLGNYPSKPESEIQQQSVRASSQFLSHNSVQSYLPFNWQGTDACTDTSRTCQNERNSNWWYTTGRQTSSYFNYFGYQEEQTSSCCPSLTWTERLFGFCLCFISGIIVSLMSFGSFSQVLLGRPAKFAVAYSMGNILALSATMFLVGPTRQFKSMTEKKRFRVTLVYISSLVMTFVSVYYLKSPIFVFICVVLQWASLVWYSLSYIPYGQNVAARMMTSVIV